MKKNKLEIVEWNNLEVGDFIENKFYRFFCFRKNADGPACLGRLKRSKEENSFNGSYVGGGVLEYYRMKPTKAFIKKCKRLLKFNLVEGNVDNLSYVEALATLKKYE